MSSRTKSPISTTKDEVYVVTVSYTLGLGTAGATTCCTGSIINSTDGAIAMSGTSPGLQTFTFGTKNNYPSILAVNTPHLYSPASNLRGKYGVRLTNVTGSSFTLEHISGSDYSAAPVAASAYNVPGASLTGSVVLWVRNTTRAK